MPKLTIHEAMLVFTMLETMAELCYRASDEKGFHNPPPVLSEMLMNLGSEISEYWEEYRRGKLGEPCDKDMAAKGLPQLTREEEELADIVIRTLHTARFRGVNIARAVAVKFVYNSTRELRHGGKVC